MNKKTPAIVTEEEEGIRLDRWFKRHYPSLPHSKLEQLLRKGAVKLDGKSAKSSQRLTAGQEIRLPAFSVEVREKKQLPLTGKEKADLQAQVLYKDKEIIVFNKPAGLAVQGGSKIKTHLDGLLSALSFSSKQPPRLVHRLDKETSGVLLLARTVNVAARLTSYFRDGAIEKTYWALLSGKPPKKQGKLLFPIRGLAAETDYQVLASTRHQGEALSWVAFFPKTGRKHQLRIHASLLGCPIWGDQKYNPKSKRGEKLHLHARALALPDRAEVFEAPLPPWMKESFAQFGFSANLLTKS